MRIDLTWSGVPTRGGGLWMVTCGSWTVHGTRRVVQNEGSSGPSPSGQALCQRSTAREGLHTTPLDGQFQGVQELASGKPQVDSYAT